MPFTIDTSGLDELLRKLERTGEAAKGIAAQALYEGAGIVADAISEGAKSIRTEKMTFKRRDGSQRLPSREEKAIVTGAGSAGIAKFRFDGVTVDTLIGYGNKGYAQAGWKGGGQVPIAKIANAINSGTSFMKKQPFIRKAVSQSQGKAIAAIEEKIRELTEKQLQD